MPPELNLLVPNCTPECQERGTVRVKCLAQEYNTMSPIRAWTWTAQSWGKSTLFWMFNFGTLCILFRTNFRWNILGPWWNSQCEFTPTKHKLDWNNILWLCYCTLKVLQIQQWENNTKSIKPLRISFCVSTRVCPIKETNSFAAI